MKIRHEADTRVCAMTYGLGMRALVNRTAKSSRRHPRWIDGAVAAVLLVAGVTETYGFVELGAQVAQARGLQVETASFFTITALTMAMVAPLVWRRRAPLTVLGLISAVQLVSTVVFKLPITSATIVTLLVAVYGASVYGAPRWRTPLRIVALMTLMAGGAYEIISSERLEDLGITTARIFFTVSSVMIDLFIFGLAWVLGDVVRIRRVREAELETRTAQLEIEREENARRAVLDERVRIARELHDVIAHHVSVMGIQAGAARRIMHAQPDRAAQALTGVEAASRQAVAELHRMLGFLRQHNDVDTLGPLPGLGLLQDLVDQMTHANLTVEVDIDGEPRAVPTSVDLSAYRIVQEALTNTLKHANATAAVVTLCYRSDAVEVGVVDDGRGAGSNERRQGNGLVGMRERVALHNGRFQAGPRPEGGFGVHATFPLQKGSS